MSEKIYIPKCSAKEIKTQVGSILKLSFDAETLSAFAKQNKNDKGYFNVCVTARKETGKFGETHSVWLDQWKPELKPAEPEKKSPIDDEDVPF